MKIFKSIIAIVILTAVLAVTARAEQYPKTLIVDSINYNNDTVTFTDTNGDEWIWYGTEDWAVNDMAAAIMDDNKTIDIHDDIIVKVYYQMNIERWTKPDEVWE